MQEEEREERRMREEGGEIPKKKTPTTVLEITEDGQYWLARRCSIVLFATAYGVVCHSDAQCSKYNSLHLPVSNRREQRTCFLSCASSTASLDLHVSKRPGQPTPRQLHMSSKVSLLPRYFRTDEAEQQRQEEQGAKRKARGWEEKVVRRTSLTPVVAYRRHIACLHITTTIFCWEYGFHRFCSIRG